MPHVYTIPNGSPYLETLVRGILSRYGHDPLTLSNLLLLLPNRRACRMVKDVFLEQCGQKAVLLPRIQPIGDMDDDILLLHGLQEEAAATPISPLEEHLLLTRLVRQWQKQYEQTPGIRSSGISYSQAADMAKELARFWNEAEREQCRMGALKELVPETLSSHWQISLEFLSILSAHWPTILKERGKISSSRYRNNVLGQLATRWQETPPSFPVVAAGSTGSIAATRRLLKTIAALPEGHVVLAGIDTHLDKESWAALDPVHPYFNTKRLLETLAIGRDGIAPWHEAEASPPMLSRAALFSETMRPAATTFRWSAAPEATHSFQQGLQGISLIEAATLQEEALVIAMQMREVLETPEKKAVLVTHDAALARYVTAALKRWDITVDSSMGQPLTATLPYRFMADTWHVAETNYSPIALLTLLKHPLLSAGEKKNHHFLARQLEKHVLRGVSVGEGLNAILSAIGKLEDKALADDLSDWLNSIAHHLAPLERVYQQREYPFAEIVTAHSKACETLSANTLWQSDAGQQVAEYVSGIIAHAPIIGGIAPQEYGAFLKNLIGQGSYRPAYGTHERLAILSPVEARLIHADKVILGGLNEGVWPAKNKLDPWMNRTMRQQFGLPPQEQAIGMAAHDFVQRCFAPEIVLTRARKIAGKPTKPSRWLQRLQAITEEQTLAPEKPWQAWGAALSLPERLMPSAPPAPTPPLSARPRALSVTQVEKWLRDPYSIYASVILNLKKLDPVDKETGAAEFGNFIHEVIDQFLQHYEDIPPEEKEAWMLQEGKSWLARKKIPAPVEAFWWPRFERIVSWFVMNEQERRQQAVEIIPECEGRMMFTAPAGEFTLKARADRIERDAEGNITIVDYKTGSVPEKGDVALGLSPQMALEGVMAAHGAFDRMPEGNVENLDYWHLTGNAEGGKKETFPANELVQQAEAGIMSLIALFDQEHTPYHAVPWRDKAPKYNDYDHLERIDEWE